MVRRAILTVALLAMTTLGQAQQGVGPAMVHLNVTVDSKPGDESPALMERDFKVLDNKKVIPFASFRAVSAKQEPVEVIVLIDSANAPFETVTYERQEVEKFLRSNGGKLAHPTSLAILTDEGVDIQKGFTTDGNGLSAMLDHKAIKMRDIRRSGGYWGATERTSISLTALHQLAAYAGGLPGRKIVLWISPGWPLITDVKQAPDHKEQLQIFGDVVRLSNALRKANLTVYDINPLGAEANPARTVYYRDFLKGIGKPSEAQIADLSLQVVSVQSGGLALDPSSDVAGMLRRCVAETELWYEIDFETAPSEDPNEYHHVEVELDKPGLAARTRDGYYTQPQ